jgi:hypothetical protein
MPSQHPHPSQRQYFKVTVHQTGLMPHHLLFHNKSHDHKNDHSCNEYSTRNSDSIATQTPHIHHQARGARLGVNLRYPTPCVYTCLGRGCFFFWEKIAFGCTHVYSFFYLRLAGFTLYSIFFLPFGVLSRERGRSLVDALYCSSALLQSLTRAHFHFRSSPHFRRPSLAPYLFFFSNEHFLFHLISSLISPQTSIINQYPIPQYLYFYYSHFSRCKVTASGCLACPFFCHYCFVVRPVARASPLFFELSGNNSFSLLAASLHAFCPTSALITPPTRFSETFHTYKHIHTHGPHISSPHAHTHISPALPSAANVKTKRKKTALAPLAACA